MDSISTFEHLNGVKGLKLVHLNVRSLVRKIDQVRMLLYGSTVDIVTFSETWLRQHLKSQLVHLDGYKSFRLDRETKVGIKGKKKRGGGLITYVNSKHASSTELLEDLAISKDYMEAQWIYMHRPHSKDICVCNMYRPPNGNLAKAISYLRECLHTLNLSKTDVFLLGDLNINYKNKNSPDYKKFSFFAKSTGLIQHITATTRNTDKSKTLIDLALTNSKFVRSSGTLDHFISDHQPIFLVHKKGREHKPKAEFSGRSYKNFDKETFESKLLNLDWKEFYTSTNPSDAWRFLHENILSVLNEMCPIKTFFIKNYRPDWMSASLIEQIKDRDYFYKKAKKTGDDDIWNIAKYLRNLTNANIRRAKRDFVLHKLKENENNAKKFWKTIQSIVPSDKGHIDNDILLKDGNAKLDRDEVAMFINDYFINVGKLNANTTLSFITPARPLASDNTPENEVTPCSIAEVSAQEVLRVIKSINTSKSSGIEHMSSHVIKTAFETLKPEVTFMYNLSIRTTQFPDSWKKALVVPIPKKGNLTKVQNFRPISLLPLPGKIMEKLMHHQIIHYLENNSLLAKEQHGFRKAHSTVHAIAQLTTHISMKFDAKLPTLAVFIDFKKAFDCVQHPILLEKLSGMNLDESVTDWVRSYLMDRQQRVFANNTYSSYQTIVQGVPQGSVLGPLFYIVYANDLSKIFKNCKFALYADDTVLYTSNRDTVTSVRKLQEDIDALSVWCQENGITVNAEKTKVMVFGSKNCLAKIAPEEIDLKFGQTTLQTVSSYTYLGLTLDNHLNYNSHVNKIISSVTSKLNQFRRMRHFLTVKAALMVYKGMLLPLLEYGDVFLTGASVANRKRLQILQNKGLRCALNKDISTSSDDLHAEASLLKLKYRREQHILNFMYDIAQDPSSRKSKSKLSVKTRSSDKVLLKTKRPRTEKFKKSLAYKGPKIWNNLPANYHSKTNKATYKHMISDWVSLRAIQSDCSFSTGDDTHPL